MRDKFDVYLQHVEDAIYLLKCMESSNYATFRQHRQSIIKNIQTILERMEKETRNDVR